MNVRTASVCVSGCFIVDTIQYFWKCFTCVWNTQSRELHLLLFLKINLCVSLNFWLPVEWWCVSSPSLTDKMNPVLKLENVKTILNHYLYKNNCTNENVVILTRSYSLVKWTNSCTVQKEEFNDKTYSGLVDFRRHVTEHLRSSDVMNRINNKLYINRRDEWCLLTAEQTGFIHYLHGVWADWCGTEEEQHSDVKADRWNQTNMKNCSLRSTGKVSL